MATEVKLPRLGQGMEAGTIVRWLKQEGDPVKKREPLYELDTDKVTQEVEAETDGILLKILIPGGEVEVGTTIAVIGKEGETAEAVTMAAPRAEPAETPAPAEAASDEEPTVPAAPAPSVQPAPSLPDGRVKASPLARRIARERGVDLATLTGTGPEGRIIAEDVEKAVAAPAPVVAARPVLAAEVEVVELTSTRKTIARRLSEAWQAPAFQLGVAADMTEVLALREQLIERLEGEDVKPTVNDVITRLVAVALVRHTALNALFTGEVIERYPTAHVGLAVAAPNGLVVPVVRSAERLSIQEIAGIRADLVGRAREGKLTMSDLEGGTFTISNLGMYGVDRFVAVLNPPQVAILAVGAAKEAPVVVDGELDIAPLCELTLTCDHRAVDGAEGAEFLRTVVALIEQPALAL
jgi:pyruvate dehydrogenase E2 component (dihydrolipoamide acetyltransferase)